MPELLDSQERRVPVPDPTTLTTLQLDQRIISLERLVFSRIDANDRATALLHENLTRVPTDTDKQIASMREVVDEKFKGIELQFKERDTRAEQSSLDSRVRVDAAFAANALSINKSEDGINRQLSQLGVLIDKAMESPRIEIASLKERLTMIEGKGFGVVATQLGHQTSSSFIVALVVAAVAVAGLVIMIADKIR